MTRRRPAHLAIEESTLRAIAARAVALSANHGLGAWKLADAYLDVAVTHRHGCALDLDGLLAADDFNFAHDVFGINRNLNRDTLKLDNCFRPRFTRKEAA